MLLENMSPDFYQLLKLNPLGKHEKALREHFSHFLYWLWAAQNTDSWHKPQFLIKGRYRAEYGCQSLVENHDS